jgi:hypothetical protein
MLLHDFFATQMLYARDARQNALQLAESATINCGHFTSCKQST